MLSRDQSRVWSLVDDRAPEPTVDERRQRITTLLQEHRWDFYADNDVDVGAQAAALDDSWAKIRCVRCDTNPAACVEAGVLGSLPTWSERESRVPVPAARGVKDLEDLEQFAREHVGKGKTLIQRVSGFFGF